MSSQPISSSCIMPTFSCSIHHVLQCDKNNLFESFSPDVPNVPSSEYEPSLPQNTLIKMEPLGEMCVDNNYDEDELVDHVTMEDDVEENYSKSHELPRSRKDTCEGSSNESPVLPLLIDKNIKNERLPQQFAERDKIDLDESFPPVVPMLSSSETVPSEVNSVLKREVYFDNSRGNEEFVDGIMKIDIEEWSEQNDELVAGDDFVNRTDVGGASMEAEYRSKPTHACDVSSKALNTSFLARHIRQHSGERSFKCEKCGKTFTLNCHLRVHMGDRPFICEQCGKAFALENNLGKHLRQHPGERPFICDLCGKTFIEACNLKAHRHIHWVERPFKCEECAKVFTQSSPLHTHRHIHTSQRSFRCDECGKTFKESGHLQVHRRIHTGERPFSCDECGKVFTQYGHLQTHLRVHTSDRPFTCKLCGKDFTRMSSLKAHHRIHTGERPFKCGECGKAFTQNGHLQAHLRVHTGTCPLNCKLCVKEFKRMSSLTSHLRIHTEERPKAPLGRVSQDLQRRWLPSDASTHPHGQTAFEMRRMLEDNPAESP